MNLNKKLVQGGAVAALAGVMTVTAVLPAGQISGASAPIAAESFQLETEVASIERLNLDFVSSPAFTEEIATPAAFSMDVEAPAVEAVETAPAVGVPTNTDMSLLAMASQISETSASQEAENTNITEINLPVVSAFNIPVIPAEEGLAEQAAAPEDMPTVEIAEEEAVAEEGMAPPVEEEMLAQEEAVVEEEVVAEPSPWENKLMPNVNEFLNIRTDPNTESAVAGQLSRGASADILERLEGWTKISSGSVEGWVSNDFVFFGAEAEAMANELGTVYATSNVEGLRVRGEASIEDGSRIVSVLATGNKIEVDTAAEAPEGWIAVKAGDTTAFVSAEFVTVEMELGSAVSMEEIRAAQEQERQERAAAQAQRAAAQAQQAAASARTQQAAVEASTSDLSLLAALIEAEAGGESYEGQLAVGAVVMNRLRVGRGGNSIQGVIYARGQFTPAHNGKLARIIARGARSSAYQAAAEALAGADNVGGRQNFRRAGARDGLVIGNHVFF